MPNTRNTFNIENGAIFLAWLFHVSAIIGIALGHFDWFITKTPLNLLLVAILMVLAYPINGPVAITFSIFFYVLGMAVEWIGVHYDFLFGSYAYGENLGPKIDGVPFLIGVNWMVLTLATAAISNRLFKSIIVRILAGAGLMVFLDIFIEQTAPMLDFWLFSGGDAPIRNYIAWYGISAFMHYLYQRSALQGNFKVSLNIYLAQLAFFIFLYGAYKL